MNIKSENGFVAVLDIHFGKKCGIRLDNIDEALIKKLEQVETYCIEKNVKALLLAGDIFDGMSTTRQSLAMIWRVFKSYKDNGIEVYGLYGNHDEMRGNIKRRQDTPLNFLMETGVVTKYPEGTLKISNDDFEYNVRGFDYFEELQNSDYDKLNSVMVGHLFFQNEFMGVKHNLEIEDLKRLGYGHYILGHDHSRYPIWEGEGMKVYRFGSLGRVSSTKSELEREVGFMHFDYREPKFIPLEVKELKDIVVAKTLKADKKEDTEINYDELIKTITSKQGLEEDTIMPVINNIEDEDIKKTILKYL